jgi:hypothetical protein
MRRAGTSKPLLRSALRTRSRASCTALPASPTMVSPGRPKATSTSTRTGAPSTPTIAALRVRASMDTSHGRRCDEVPVARLLASQTSSGDRRCAG